VLFFFSKFYQLVGINFTAFFTDNADAVELLLQRGAFVDCVDMEDSQPLLIASYANNINIAQILVHFKANVNLAPRQGYSPLHHAAWEGHTAMCKLLLTAGAENDTQTRDKNTPLALACHGDYLDTISLLLTQNCNVNNQDKDLDAPIHYCTYNGNYDAVTMLLHRGANPDIVNALNVTPIWNAVYADSLLIVELLIQANVRLNVPSQGIDQHAETDHPTLIYNTPRTPLYVACSRDDMRIAERIVLAGSDFGHERWYWRGDFPQELRDNARLLHWITHQATRPQSLMRMTRTLIRKNMLGLHPLSKVETLEIPKVLKEFLYIKSFAVDL
jgi:ankyrin repeat protein